VFIVDSSQVTYCLVSSRLNKARVQQPGLEYQGKLYLKDAVYRQQDKQMAVYQARQKLLEDPDQLLLIVDEGDTLSLWYQPKKPQKVNSIFAIDLAQLAAAMQQPNGVTIQDRTFRLKTYAQCFVGSEAVDWLVNYLRVSRADAVRVGQRLLSENWIRHVVNEQTFQDDYFFYRFQSE
jgi:hypothetical protein